MGRVPLGPKAIDSRRSLWSNLASFVARAKLVYAPVLLGGTSVTTITAIRSRFGPLGLNSYLIAGNVCNAFALGDVGSEDDFFLIGAEPSEESSYPLLTGNILDSEGKVLFRLVQNVLVINPGRCSKILGNQIGYEIHDAAGNLILRLHTAFEALPGTLEKSFVTTITANFYDRTGSLVFRANSGQPDERIESSVRTLLGFSNGVFSFASGVSPQDEMIRAAIALESHGAIHKVITGTITSKDLPLDGALVLNANIINSTLRLETGHFDMAGSNQFVNVIFLCTGPAARIKDLIRLVDASQK